MTVRICWFIMVHQKPAQFEWLMSAIRNPEDLFLIHVDLKSRLGLKRDRRGVMREVRRVCAGQPNVRLMRSRFTNWGGWSLSRMLLDAIGSALRTDDRWTHFINMSGQCYPLKPLARIRQEIEDSAAAVRVEMRPFASLPADDWHLRWHPMFETPLKALTLPGRRTPPSGFRLEHKGSQWVILPRDFCEWLTRDPMTRRIRSYLRRLLLSDELIMQTLADNSPFRDRLAPYRRHIVWPGPRVLDTTDLPAIVAGDAWIGRKFDLEHDAGVIETLAQRNGFAPGPHPPAAGAG